MAAVKLDSISIRLFSIGDYDDVYSLWQNTPNLGLNDIDDSRAGIGRYLKRNPTTCFVAVDNREHQRIGAILAGHDGRRGFIHHTAVTVPWQGQGIGTALVESALAALQREQISKVGLLVFAENEAGNRFWQARGFAERHDLHYRNLALIELRRLDT